MIDCLLESKAKEQLIMWDKAMRELPLHTAARIGFLEVLALVFKDNPDVNIVSGDGYKMDLYHAAEGYHSQVVGLLLEYKAQLLPSRFRNFNPVGTPFHATLQCGDHTKVCDL